MSNDNIVFWKTCLYQKCCKLCILAVVKIWGHLAMAFPTSVPEQGALCLSGTEPGTLFNWPV